MFILSYFSLQKNLYAFSYQKIREEKSMFFSFATLMGSLPVFFLGAREAKVFSMADHCYPNISSVFFW